MKPLPASSIGSLQPESPTFMEDVETVARAVRGLGVSGATLFNHNAAAARSLHAEPEKRKLLSRLFSAVRDYWRKEAQADAVRWTGRWLTIATIPGAIEGKLEALAQMQTRLEDLNGTELEGFLADRFRALETRWELPAKEAASAWLSAVRAQVPSLEELESEALRSASNGAAEANLLAIEVRHLSDAVGDIVDKNGKLVESAIETAIAHAVVAYTVVRPAIEGAHDTLNALWTELRHLANFARVYPDVVLA